MSRFVLVKELPGGFFEYVAEVPGMLPAKRADMAAQIKEEDIGLFDAKYLAAEGYRFEELAYAEDDSRLFVPPLPFYRPRIVRRRVGALALRQAAQLTTQKRPDDIDIRK